MLAVVLIYVTCFFVCLFVCLFYQAISIDLLESGPRIAVIMDLDPLWMLWDSSNSSELNSHGYVPTTSTTTKARLVLATGALVVYSNVL